MERRGMAGVIAYIDDFLLTASSKEECIKMSLSLIILLPEFGFDMSWKKVVGPHNESDFWGWTLTREAAPCRKVRTNCSSSGNGYFNSRASGAQASKQQLESLAGSLNWVCHTVSGVARSLNWACQTVLGLAGTLKWACQTV